MAENPYGLSPQDIQDLQQIKSVLPAGDPRHAKLDTLLSAAPTYSPEAIKAMAMNAQTAKNMQPINASYGADATAPKASMPPVDQSPLDYAKALGGEVVGASKGLAKTAINTANIVGAGMAGPAGGGIAAMVNPPDTSALDPKTLAEKTGNFVEGAAELAAPLAGGNAAAVAGKIIPSVAKAQAGEKFADVAQAANNLPVSLSNAQDPILKLINWQGKTQLGPTINKFLNRVTAPGKAPINFADARDFYSLLTRLSSDEISKLPKVVQGDVNGLVAGLDADLTKTASIVGKGQQYAEAVSQYASGAKGARTVESLKQFAKDAAVKAALYGTAGGAAAATGYGVYNAFKK